MRSSAGKLISHSQWMRNRSARFRVPASSCDSQKMWNSTAPPPPDERSPDQNSIDAGSSMRRPISLWPGMYHSPVTNALWEARRNMFETPTGGEDASPSELTAKTPSRSRTSILYKFSSDFVLREQYRNPWNEIRTGKLVVNLDARSVEVDSKSLHLTSKEYGILELLSLRKGSTITKEMFLNHLYGGIDEPELKIIDVFVCKLRKKLQDAAGGENYIETVWGRGYVLRDPQEALNGGTIVAA